MTQWPSQASVIQVQFIHLLSIAINLKKPNLSTMIRFFLTVLDTQGLRVDYICLPPQVGPGSRLINGNKSYNDHPKRQPDIPPLLLTCPTISVFNNQLVIKITRKGNQIFY